MNQRIQCTRTSFARWTQLLSLWILGVLIIFANCPSFAGQTVVSDPSWYGVPGAFRAANVCTTKSSFWMVGGQGDVVRSSKSGEFRQQLSAKDQSFPNLRGVFADDSGRILVVGSDGIIFASYDDGVKWTQQTVGSDMSLEAVTCIDRNRCWTVGENGMILKSVSAGKKWQRVRVGAGERLLGVEFPTARNGWVVGEEGLILKTVDGGNTWTERRLRIRPWVTGADGGFSDLRAVRFVDEFNGWVAGSDGIFRTSDGGNTWTSTILEGEKFVGLVTNDGIHLWAVSTGANYCSGDSGANWSLCDESKSFGVYFKCLPKRK